jgi:hypothetical protein
MRLSVAVRIDIRPRLTLRDEPRVKPRRRWRLPPLAVPATGYWLAMAALTYFFAHLGPSPLDLASAAPIEDVSNGPALAPVRLPVTVPDVAAPVAPVTVPQQPVLRAVTEPEAPLPLASAGERAREHEPHSTNRREQRSSEEPLTRHAEPAPRLEFPEFSDSSVPTRRERAADGPRIDSLFERREERPAGDAAPPTPPTESERDAPATLSSCENAIARNNEQISIGGPRGPADVTREAYASILQNGRYLSGCSIPDRTVFEICAAVRDGRAVGITVTSSPASPSLNACVRRAVSRLKFPQNSRLDVTHTRFDAVPH